MKTNECNVFVHTLLLGSSKYIHDANHCWLSVLVKEYTPVGVEQIKTADMHACLYLLIKKIS